MLLIEKKIRDYYLSNTTQLACAFLASAATAPQGDPETILILTFICWEKIGNKYTTSTLNLKEPCIHQSYQPCLDHRHYGAEGSSESKNQ